MKRSEQINELAGAKAKAQLKMRNPSFDSTNPHFKSKFASLAAVRDVVIPAFAAEGISVSQDATLVEDGAAVSTILTHTSGQWEEYGPLTVPLSKRDAHGIGSAISYAKRYHLMAVAAVVGDQDDDGNGAVGNVGKPAEPARAQPDPFTHDPTIVGSLKAAKTLDELQAAWKAIPANVRARYTDLKDAAKDRITEAVSA